MNKAGHPGWALAAAGALALGIVGWQQCGREDGLRDDMALAAYRDVYAGSRSCRECHERFYDLWATSFHGLSMQAVTRAFTAEALTPHETELVIGDAAYRAFYTDEGAWMEERTADGIVRYPILQALGGKYFYFFLTELDRGRLQVLPLAYHVEQRDWYDAPASMLRHAEGVIEDDEALDWRERPLTFNTACYSCHVSQVEPHYDPATDSYATVWREPGINCETCHGPSAEHVQAARRLAPGEVMTDFRLTSMAQMPPRQRDDACATCHAKARPLTPEFRPGDRFFDHYDLVTLEDRDFYPDGRDLGENYTFTRWLMSPCLASEQMECIHCHTSSGRFRFRESPNDSCLPCHRQRVEQAPAHTRHPADSQGNQCISCHMPMTTFAHMRRSDHAMLPPTPSATLAHQSPNACNVCHDDQDAQWADAHVRRWRTRDYQAPVLHRAGLVQAARERQWARLPEMLALVEEPTVDEITRTSLLRLMTAAEGEDVRLAPVLRRLTRDPSPLVRSAAATALGGLRDGPQTHRALVEATADDVRLVRIQAAEALALFPHEALTPQEQVAVDRATAEFKTSLVSRPDDWASQYNLGNFHLYRQEPRQALTAFAQATRLYPEAIPPRVNAAMVHAQLGELAASVTLLLDAHALEPAHPAVNFNLGLALAETDQTRLAEQHLRLALQHDPRMAAAAYNLGLLLMERDPALGLGYLRHAWKEQPGEARYGYTLAHALQATGETGQAVAVLESMVADGTDLGDAYLLLGDLHERRQAPAEARRVYRAALEHEGLPPAHRQQAVLRLRRLDGEAGRGL